MARSPHKKNKEVYRPGAWLYWVALLCLVVGGTLSYMLYQKGPGARSRMSLAIAFTMVTTGISFICASANWWLKR